MRDVADAAGVAISSVSRVLSGHPDVSQTMRDRVTEAVERLGYKPDLLAQGLRKRETHSVGFVVGDISNPVLAEVVAGAEGEFREAGYSVLLTDSEGRPELEPGHVQLLAQRRVDALLLSLASEAFEPTFEALRPLDIPIMLVDRNAPDDIHTHAIHFDHRHGMRDAIGRLLDLGHRHIGLILGSPVRPSNERRAAFVEAHEHRGLRAPEHLVLERSYSAQHGSEATRRLLSDGEPPTAIVAGGNQIAIGVLDELVARGLQVGRDLSFISCDDLPLARLHRPALSVVRRDNRLIGSTAARSLLRLLRGDHDVELISLPTEYVERETCAPPA